MERKNFNKNVQMHLACEKDDLRPIMACIYFKNGFDKCTATFKGTNNPIVFDSIEDCA